MMDALKTHIFEVLEHILLLSKHAKNEYFLIFLYFNILLLIIDCRFHSKICLLLLHTNIYCLFVPQYFNTS
jgi:hypothetical protein